MATGETRAPSSEFNVLMTDVREQTDKAAKQGELNQFVPTGSVQTGRPGTATLTEAEDVASVRRSVLGTTPCEAKT